MTQFPMEEPHVQSGHEQQLIKRDQHLQQQIPLDFDWTEQEEGDIDVFSFAERGDEDLVAQELMRQFIRQEESLSNEALWQQYKQEQGQ